MSGHACTTPPPPYPKQREVCAEEERKGPGVRRGRGTLRSRLLRGNVSRSTAHLGIVRDGLVLHRNRPQGPGVKKTGQSSSNTHHNKVHVCTEGEQEDVGHKARRKRGDK